MSTKQTANVYVTNNTGGEAFIQMSHRYSGHKKTDVGNWHADAGETVGPLVVNYETGTGTGIDLWYCSASVMSGPNAGIYTTRGKLLDPMKECMLESSDAGQDITNTLDTSKFHINLPSGGCSTGMIYLAPYAKITNVFTLMLENHSFDHLFGFSDYNSTINKLTGNESNTYKGTSYQVNEKAVDPMPVGPGHEFMNTLVQLCGEGTTNPFPGGTYPAINNSGFVADYAAEGAAGDDCGDVMDCCDPSSKLPNLYKLAQNFALCDNWFSSMPGPTWPNRLFAMGASSSGLDDSPTSGQIKTWETVSGFTYTNGSIFDQLKKYTLKYRLYNDMDNQFTSAPNHASGQFPVVAGLKNISLSDVNSLETFRQDLCDPYPYQFTWIEPNYGDASGDFSGGSSQHPKDTLKAGDKMIADIYDTIRTSPYWWTSVLIITYDEHGGYYDHLAPPAATPPGDNPNYGLNINGFDFSQYGVRVPAVVVSPFTPKGAIDHTLYDHTSVLKTLESIWKMTSLTNRDKGANDLMNSLSSDPRRTDTPIAISAKISSSSTTGSFIVEPEDIAEPQAVAGSVSATASADTAELDARPLPERGNIIGFLHVALKAEVDLSDGSDASKQAIIDHFKATVHTYGDARAYFKKVAAEVAAARAANQAAPQKSR